MDWDFFLYQLIILDYADSKEDFINKYKYVTTNFLLSDNLWNSSKNWTYKGGKESEMVYRNFKFELTGKLKNITNVWSNSDNNHSNNEHTKISFKENWNSSKKTLELYINMEAMVKWMWGSIIHHAAIIKMLKPDYHFRNTSIFTPIVPSSIRGNHSNDKEFYGYYSGVHLKLSGFTSLGFVPTYKVSVPIAKMFETIFNIGYFANKLIEKPFFSLDNYLIFTTSIQVAGIWYAAFIQLNFSADSLMSLDQNANINSFWPINQIFKGKLEFNRMGNETYFTYTNRFGLIQKSNSQIHKPYDIIAMQPLVWLGIGISTYLYVLEIKDKQKLNY